jgi:hypothetical protein
VAVRVVLTHGNGPIIGNIQLRNEAMGGAHPADAARRVRCRFSGRHRLHDPASAAERAGTRRRATPGGDDRHPGRSRSQ